MNPADPLVFDYIPNTGSMSGILELAARYNYDVVVKPLKGTGGINVTRTTTAKEIESAVYKCWSRDYGVAISPFVDIIDEIRVVVFLGSVRLMYRKRRVSVESDGSKTVQDLIREKIASSDPSHIRPLAKALCSLSPVELKKVPLPGETVPIEWRHNLGLGASAEVCECPEAAHIAQAAARALNMKFCSVDLVMLSDNSLLVLEVNSGVMMDSFLKSSKENGSIAKQIYTDVITHSLA